MTNKIIVLLAVIVMALAVVAYKLSSSSGSDESDAVTVDEVTQKPVVTPPTITKPDTSAGNKNESKSSPDINAVSEETQSTDDKKTDEKLCQLVNEYDDWYPKGDSYESENFMSEVKAWAFSRGYFETEYSKGSLGIKKQSDYDYYDIEDLEAMAKAGDSMANVRLAYRLYLKGGRDNMERAQPYCDRAIADGYTALVMCKSSYLTAQIYLERQKEGEDADPDKLKSLELDYLAWQQASAQLGDELGSKLTESMLPDLEHEFEQGAIKQRAQELVESTEAERERLGIVEREHPPIPELLTYVLEKESDPMGAFKSCVEKEPLEP